VDAQVELSLPEIPVDFHVPSFFCLLPILMDDEFPIFHPCLSKIVN
jgi:hypothetical protein